MKWWALSFAMGPSVCVVRAKNFSDAISRAKALDIHPGGPTRGRLVPEGKKVAPKNCNRLIVGLEIFEVFEGAAFTTGPAGDHELDENGEPKLS